MKREELFMEILGDLDDKFVAEAVPRKLKDDAPENETESSAEAAVSEKPEDNVEISKRDLRVYYALRAVGIAAAAVLIVGGIVLLVRNWDMIAVKDPERPANITTAVTQTTPVTSEAPVADDRMLDTSMPANPFLLPEPSGYEGLESYTSRYKPEFVSFGWPLVELVGKDEFSAWIGEYEREKLYDMSGAEHGTILSFVQRFDIPKEKLREAVKSLNKYEAEAGVLDDEDIEVIYSGNAVKIAERFAADYAVVCSGRAYSPMWLYEHTTEAYRAAGITPDLIAARIEQYEEEFTRSPEHRHMSDDAWNAFYAKLAGYAGITVRLPDVSELVVPTGKTEKTFELKYEYVDAAEGDFLPGLGANAASDGAAYRMICDQPMEAFMKNIEHGQDTEILYSLLEPYNDNGGLNYEKIKSELPPIELYDGLDSVRLYGSDYGAFAVSEDYVIHFSDALNVYGFKRTEYDSQLRRGLEMLWANYDKLKPLTVTAVSEKAMPDGSFGEPYLRISADSGRIELIKTFFNNNGLRLNYFDFISTDTETSVQTFDYYPIPVTLTLDCKRNEIDDEVRDFLVANADDIDAFRTLYLRGYDDPRAVPTMIDYPYGAAPAVENKFYLQDTSKLPFDDIAGMREWMDRIFDEGYNLAWQPTLTETREIDGELVEPVFIQINGQLYRREGTGNTACEMDYRTAKVVEVSVDDVYDGGRIKDGVIWFACVGTENHHAGYEAFYGRITVTDGVMKLAELPGHSLTEYRGETTGEISDIWNDRATYKVENQLIDANERITNEVTVELPIENKVVGAEALKLFDDVFYGEWVMTDDAFLREWVMTDDSDDHTIMLTYRDDMFTFENWCYPEYIVEDDRFYYLSFIAGGVPDCYIVEKGEPEILYHASYNGGSEYIIHRDRAKYRRKNDFLHERTIKAGDEISRFGLWKLMTEYNEALWMRFQEETGFRFPTGFESEAGFTDADGRAWTMSSTLSEPLQRVWFLGGNGTDTIMLGLRYHSAEEWDTYAANDYKLAYQPKEYYFALRITTDEEMNSSVEYFTMDEVYDLDETLTYSSNLPQ